MSFRSAEWFERDGDLIDLDTPVRSLTLQVSDEELAQRRARWSPSPQPYRRGYPRLYADHVLQPDEGCDLDFLRATSLEDLELIQPIVGRS